MKKRSFIETGMIHWRIVLTFTVLMVAAGVYSFFTMPRQEFPDFTIREGLVIGLMPGATSHEVEEQMAKPVEDYLFSFNEVNKKKTYSTSKEGLMIAHVEVLGRVKGLEASAFWSKLRHGLREFQQEKLPAQAIALIGNNDFGDTSALLFTLVADGRSPRDLAKYMETLQASMRRIEATAKLRTFGELNERISVTISRDRIARYGIGPVTLLTALQSKGITPAPARLDADQLEMPIHVDRVLRSEAEIGDTLLLSLPTGAQVRLKDVADIRREYPDDEPYVRFNGKTAMLLSIEMHQGHDITHFGKEVDQAIAEAKRELPDGVTIARVADQPRVVKTSVGHFGRDFALAILSVILVTMVLLPLRVAAVAAISIPVCIAMTLSVLNLLGVELQTVSLAGLVVVLGMVVDNAIVVIDDHVEKLDRGLGFWEAAWKSAKDLTIPVLAATVAIIFAYLPLPFLITGAPGDFVSSLPVTIGVALIISMGVAVLLVPIMNASFIRKGLHRGNNKRSMLDRVQSVFNPTLEAAFRHPVITLVAGAVAIVLGVYLVSVIPQQPFPKIERNQFTVEISLPSGHGIKEVASVAERLEKTLLADKRVVNVTSFIGQGSPRFHTIYAPHEPERNFGQLLVNTTTEEATVEVLRNAQEHTTGVFPEGWVRWRQLNFLNASPVEVRISANDIPTLKRVASKIEAHARTIPGTLWVRNDYEDAKQSIRVIPDSDACTRLGVPHSLLQASLAIGTQGLPIGTVWEGDYPVKVLLKDEQWNATHIEGLRQQYVTSLFGGAAVPLDQLAELRPAWDEGAIVRRNGVRTLTVKIDIAMDALGDNVQKAMDSHIKKLEVSGDLEGARITYGGEKEMGDEAYTSMTISMIVSVVLIFLVLLFEFKRFRKVLSVMLAMPLSLLGGILGLKLAHYPFGVTAFVGVIGLLGIVVRNGIILVTYAEELRRDHHMSARDAAIAAGKRRMRPITLTSVAAAIGVVPMILSRSLLWGPLGTVTCFGLLIAMVLTLLILPVAYWKLNPDQPAKEPTGKPGAAMAAITTLVIGLLAVAPAHATEASYSLARCRELAVKQNATLREAALDIESACETKASAYTKYFPNVSATAFGMLAADPLLQIKSSGGNLPVYDGNPANLATATQFAYMPPTTIKALNHGTTLALGAAQTVFAGGRVVNGNRLAEVAVTAAEEKATLARRDVLVDTDEKYWRVVTLEEKLRTLDAYERLLAELDKQVTDAVNSGILTKNNQLKVRLKRAEATVDRQRLEDGIRLSTRDLRHHIGLPEGDAIVLSDTLAEPIDPSPLKQAATDAIARRPETHLLESLVRAEGLQASIKRGTMLPTLAVGANLFRIDFEGMPGATNALVFGVLTVPLTDIWTGAHDVAGQRAKENIARTKLADTRELLALQIDKAWSDVMTAWQAAQVSERAVEQADVNLQEETDRHSNGLIPFSDLLDAQVLRQLTLDKRIETRGDFWVKRSVYLRAIAQDM